MDVLAIQRTQMRLQPVGIGQQRTPVYAVDSTNNPYFLPGISQSNAFQAAGAGLQLIDRSHPVRPNRQMVASDGDLKHALINIPHAPLLGNPERLQSLVAGEVLLP